MRRIGRILALVFVTFMILGSAQIQATVSNFESNQSPSASRNILKTAGYDSPNITATVLSPANGTEVSSTFDISLNMTSDFATLNLTLFIDGAINPAYNRSSIAASPSWIQNITVNSASLGETWHNFTILFENLAERESVYLLYYVNNIQPDFQYTIYGPANESTVNGIISIDFNIVSDYDQFNLTLFVDGSAQSSELLGTGNGSIGVDTSTLMEGIDNFTLFFQYNVLQVHFDYSIHLIYIVDNNGLPITIDHLSPANQTEVSGTFDLVLLIESNYEPLNFTLFVNGVISQYNKTPIGIKEQSIPINTLPFDEGPANFTLLFEYNMTGENAVAIYHLVFTINNHGKPVVVFISPTDGSTVTGLTDLWLNITSSHPSLFLNITVDGVIVPEYNSTPIVSGAFNYTLNTSRYENGHHLISITAFTGEGESSTVERTLIFLDYVRVWITGVSSHDTISGEQLIIVRMQSASANCTMSLYVDHVLAKDVNNVTIFPGDNVINFNTTVFSEGAHNITIVAYDPAGHSWIANMLLIINNKGAPELRFITRAQVVVGFATFEIGVDSDWSNLTVAVYVDGKVVPNYDNITVDVSSGAFSFKIDVGNYAKTEHTVRVVMITPEGDSAEVERVFGFASIRIEEVITMAILLGLAILIPLYRWKKNGQSLKTVLIVDTVFFLVIIGAFLLLGINTIPFITWHINLASISAIGGILVFTNWSLPFIMEEPES